MRVQDTRIACAPHAQPVRFKGGRLPTFAPPMPTKSGSARTPRLTPVARPLLDAADALFRAARESCHQHQRLSRLHERGADDAEFSDACELTALCDSQLAERTERYTEVAKGGRGKEPEDVWRVANALWMASREYGRRNATSDAAGAKLKRHDSARLGELTMDYELEMSARLALKQAIEAYGAVRPDAS